MMKIIIIGASSGLGYEIARRYILRGETVGIAARREEPLEELKALAPERVSVGKIDVTTDDAPQKLLDLIAKTGGMDLYFHVSRYGKQNKTLETDIELKTFSTNALASDR